MANVNLFELEGCLVALKGFCEQNPRKPYVLRYRSGVEEAQRLLKAALTETDQTYTRWRLEMGGDQLAHKHLQRAFKRLQGKLRELGAVGWPEEPVSYWDDAKTVEAAKEMLAFLEEHQKGLDFAAEGIAELKGLLGGSTKEAHEHTEALEAYRRVAAQRKEGMELALDIVSELREELRADLGRDSEAYRAMKWPAMLNSDPL